jgi:hypothetical protein
MRKLFILFACIVLAGCASGNRYNYSAKITALPLKAGVTKTLLLTLQDRRPYVLSGEKKADFVGLQRGGFGNPFDVTTASGKPMTEDMAQSLAASLEQAGYRVNVVDGNPGTSELVKLAKSHNAFRIVRLQVFEWKSDTYMSIGLHYDLHLAIYDPAGERLAENSMSGHEAVGGAKISSDKNSEHMADEFGKRIGYLFNKPTIRNALSVNGSSN